MSVVTHPIRLVVADDTPDVRLLLRLGLERDGAFSVVAEAGDGREAVDAVDQYRPDAVLLDLAMPVMDGLEAIPLLRQRSPDTGIVVISGFDASRMETHALQEGADAYVAKGCAPDDLAAAVRRVVHARHGGGSDGSLVAGWAAAVVDGGRVEVGYRRNQDLLPVVGHQLLNALTVISGYATTLRMAEAGQADMVAQCAEVIERQADRMERLIRSASEARHMELGTLELQRQTVDLVGLVEAIVAESEVDADRVKISAPTSALAVVDPTRVKHLIANLIANAATFGPAGGPISVEMSVEDGAARVRVRDAGPGIPPADRDRVFDKFSKRQPKTGGAGLGLYTGLGIARAHHGDLRLLDGEPSTCFELSLPAA